MAIVLRWREEPFDCEFRDGRGGGTLTLYQEGEVIWKESVPSAALAHDRSREARETLLPRRAKRA
jgi:hypothetical protein